MTTTAPWIESIAIADEPTPTDVRAFFGVPPDPEELLDRNISKKRRTWSARIRGRKPTPEAKQKVEQALALISFLAEYLKRGVEEPLDLADLRELFRHAPSTTVDEIGDLWRVVEEILANGQLDEALRVANDARNRFGEPVAHAVFAWVASLASRAQDDPSERLRLDGLEAAEQAIVGGIEDAGTFSSRAILQLDLGRGTEALAGLQQAERSLDGVLDATLSMCFVEAYVATGDVDEASRRAVAAVDADPADLTVRSGVATALITAIRGSLLPIADASGLARYQRIAEVAAWCAEGAPEAEDLVRPFRMWSVVADNRMYAGDIGTRALLAVFSGFLLLPLINRVRSKPQWKVLYEGPSSVSPVVFAEVALGAVSRAVHDGLTDRLTWWDDYVAQLGAGESEGGR